MTYARRVAVFEHFDVPLPGSTVMLLIGFDMLMLLYSLTLPIPHIYYKCEWRDGARARRFSTAS